MTGVTSTCPSCAPGTHCWQWQAWAGVDENDADIIGGGVLHITEGAAAALLRRGVVQFARDPGDVAIAAVVDIVPNAKRIGVRPLRWR